LCDSSGLPLPASVSNLNSPKLTAIKVFPDPAQESIFVQWALLQPGNTLITITDMMGRVLLQNKENTKGKNVSAIFDISGFAAGMYLVEVKTETEQFVTKFIKN